MLIGSCLTRPSKFVWRPLFAPNAEPLFPELLAYLDTLDRLGQPIVEPDRRSRCGKSYRLKDKCRPGVMARPIRAKTPKEAMG